MEPHVYGQVSRNLFRTVRSSSNDLGCRGVTWTNLTTTSPSHHTQRRTLPSPDSRHLSHNKPVRPFNYRLNQWERLSPQKDWLRVLEAIPRGEGRNHLAVGIKQETANQKKTLVLFCQGSKLNNRGGTPTGTTVCLAWRLRKEISHTMKSLGPNSCTSDTALEALLLVTHYIRDGEGVNHTEIRSTDTNVARDCLKAGTRDHMITLRISPAPFQTFLMLNHPYRLA